MTRKLPDAIPFFVADSPTNNSILIYDSTNKYFKDTAVVPATATGSVISISLDTTGGNATVPNTDTDIATYSLGANTYSKIMIEGTVEVLTGALSTIQDITFKAKIGTSTKSFIVPSLNVAGRRYAHVTMQAAQTGAATMAISHGAAAADANTTDYVHNLYVWGIV